MSKRNYKSRREDRNESFKKDLRNAIVPRFKIKEATRWDAEEAHVGPVLATAFDQKGNILLTCGEDKKICVWDCNRGKSREILNSHGCNDLDITSDGSKFYSCDDLGRIFYSDMASGRLIKQIDCHKGQVNAVKCWGNGVLSAGSDRMVYFWDHRSDELIEMFKEHFKSDVTCLSLTSNAIVAGCLNGTVSKFDTTTTGTTIANNFTYDLVYPVKCISSSRNGNCAIASCLDSTLRLLNVHRTRSTSEIVQEYKGHTCKSSKMDCCFMYNDDTCIVGGSEDGTVFLWDVKTAQVLSSVKAHTSAVTSIARHPQANRMVTASRNGMVRFWEVMSS